LPDRSVDGIYATLSLRHFSDLAAAERELARICRDGPVVFFTIDPQHGEPFWFADYFPAIHGQTYDLFPPLGDIAEQLSEAAGRRWQATVTAFPLPADYTDLNMNAGGKRPEIDLDPLMRQNTSGFALAEPAGVTAGLARLKADLASGAWDAANGDLRRRAAYDLGFRFLNFTAK
jgi:ubiquinone/menaquinone biosynthesis C-methylase UbiE